jgi:hypothetical protein
MIHVELFHRRRQTSLESLGLLVCSGQIMIHFVSTPFVHTGESLDTILVKGGHPR